MKRMSKSLSHLDLADEFAGEDEEEFERKAREIEGLEK